MSINIVIYLMFFNVCFIKINKKRDQVIYEASINRDACSLDGEQVQMLDVHELNIYNNL